MPCEMISYEGHIAQSAAEPTPSPHTSTFPSFAYIDPTEGENLVGHSLGGPHAHENMGSANWIPRGGE